MFARKAIDYLRKWVEESKENIALRLWNGPMTSGIVRKMVAEVSLYTTSRCTMRGR